MCNPGVIYRVSVILEVTKVVLRVACTLDIGLLECLKSINLMDYPRNVAASLFILILKALCPIS